MSNELLVAAVLVFFAAFASLETILNWWNSTRGAEARRIRKRLSRVASGGNTGADADSLLKKRIRRYGAADRSLKGRILNSAEALLIESGSDRSIQGFLGIMLMSGLAAGLMSLLRRMTGPIVLLIGCVAASTCCVSPKSLI